MNYLVHESATKQETQEDHGEALLIQAAREQDQEAFTKLYHRYVGQVYAFCTRMLQGKADVEDTVQQVFLEAWRSLHRFEGRSLFSTWLIKIAIHMCLSHYRRSGRVLLAAEEETDLYDQATDVMWAKPQILPDEYVWETARRKAIIKILNRITKKKQVVFILSYMQELSAPEISEILGIPPATVRTRLFHARREFQYWMNRNPVYKDLLSPQAKNERAVS